MELNGFSQCKIFLDFIVQCSINRIRSPDRGRVIRVSTLVPQGGREGMTMVKNFEEFQQVGKENVDLALKSMGMLSKGTQAIATEVADTGEVPLRRLRASRQG